jgi:hypothetical protein
VSIISDALCTHAVRVAICRAMPDAPLREPESRPRRREISATPCAIGNMCSISIQYLRKTIL